MASGTPFVFVDVFAQSKYQGNPLAVFWDCALVDGSEMQKIANEINFSETTFITDTTAQNGAFGVRIFTPASEIPFAGHPVLGTAWVINRFLVEQPLQEVALNLGVGQVPVRFPGDGDLGGVLWMNQPKPDFGEIIGHADAATMVGLDSKDLDSRFPVQDVSTGLPFFIVPVNSLDALKKARTNVSALEARTGRTRAKAVCLFCAQGREGRDDLSMRVFVDYLGIPEDPATGSAAGCLAAYLFQYKVIGSGPVDAVAGQGHEVGRPSRLYLKASAGSKAMRVSVGGKVAFVAKGQWE